jgi:hypothetical protein
MELSSKSRTLAWRAKNLVAKSRGSTNFIGITLKKSVRKTKNLQPIQKEKQILFFVVENVFYLVELMRQ